MLSRRSPSHWSAGSAHPIGLPLLLLPVSLIILNPPPRPRLIDPALGKDRLDPGDAFFGDVVRFSNFRIERIAIAIFRGHQLLGVGTLLEAQAVRTAYREHPVLSDADITAIHVRFDRVAANFDRFLQCADRGIGYVDVRILSVGLAKEAHRNDSRWRK